MQQSKRQELEERRRQHQLRQGAETFAASSLQSYVEILDYLDRQGVALKIIQLMYVRSEWKIPIQTILQGAPYAAYGFRPDHLEGSGMEEKMDELYLRYPSTNPLRYVPSLPKLADYNVLSPGEIRNGLKKAAALLGLSNQKVFLYYLRYAPLIEVSLFDILEHDHKDLFNFWHGDAVIFPADLSWLMAFTLEEEWYAGKYEI